MTEEVKNEEVKLSPTEEKALAMGWRPKSEWNGPEEEFIDAGEFVRRKPLFDKIEHQSRKLKSVETTLQQLAAHNAKISQIEYQKAMTELRHAKREALKENDGAAALEIEDRMEAIHASHMEAQRNIPQVPPPEQGPSPEFLNWVEYNGWYKTDREMQSAADLIAEAFILGENRKGRQPTQEEIFRVVDKKIRIEYPDNFENPNRNRASAVGSGDRATAPSKTAFKLTEMEEEVARNFARNGVMTREKYIEQLKEMEAKGQR